MTEIITLGCSHPSNHILTHLFNNQESHIPYTKLHTLKYTNSMFLTQSAVEGKKNYHPRALLYDVRNGFGALNKYEYYEKPPGSFPGVEIVNTGAKVHKNEYQLGLDNGLNKADLLTKNSIKYWSDYNKLIYKPMALNSLNDWEFDVDSPDQQIYNKFTPDLKFTNYDLGQTEFANNVDDNLDLFRKYLEDCDSLQGIQVFSQSDNAWSGFTNEWLTNVKDEFFNYTSNNKFNMWTWDLLSPRKLSAFETLTRIKSLVEFHKNCSLVIPLNMSQSSTLWETSGLLSVLVNSVWELMNCNEKVSNMTDFELRILGNDFNRNIVNQVSLNSLKDVLINLLSIVDTKDPMDQESINLGFNDTSRNFQFANNSIVNEWDKSLLDINSTINAALGSSRTKVYYSKNDLLDITKIDTFPKAVIDFDKVYLSFSITDSFKHDIKSFIKIVQRFKLVDNIVGDKQELLHDLYNMKQMYSSGPEFEDDSDNDYYYE